MLDVDHDKPLPLPPPQVLLAHVPQSELECAAAVKGILLSYGEGEVISDPSHHQLIKALLDLHPRCVTRGGEHNTLF